MLRIYSVKRFVLQLVQCFNDGERYVLPGVHLRSESEINVESCFLSSGHTTESTLGQFRHLCQKASPTVVDIVHPDV